MATLYDHTFVPEQTVLPEAGETGPGDYVLDGIPFDTFGTGTLRLTIDVDIKYVSGENNLVVGVAAPGSLDIGDASAIFDSFMQTASNPTGTYATYTLVKEFGTQAYVDFTGPGAAQSIYFHAPRTFLGGFAGTTYKIQNIHVVVESLGGGGGDGVKASPGPYETWLPGQGPDWLMGPNGQALKAALGAELDYHEDRVRWGVRARFPTKGSADKATGGIGPAPDDALAQIGFDRMLRRGPGELSGAYAARLQNAWDAWAFAGSHYGLLRALQIAGYADMKVVQQNGRYAYLSGTAGDLSDLSFGSLMTCATRAWLPGWTFDWRDEFYSQFGLVFTSYAENISESNESGQAILNEIVREWKPAKAYYAGAWVIRSGMLLGWPTERTLGTDPNLGGNDTYCIKP